MNIIKKALRNPGKGASILSKKILKGIGHRNYRHFIVLTRSRTGSNMVSSLLNSHPNIDVQGEIFSKLNGQTYKDVLASGFSKQPFYIKAAGFKIFYYHPLDDPSSDIWNDLVKMKNLHVIHLKRRNVLRSLISSKISTNQNIWRSIESKGTSKLSERTVTLTEEELRDGFEYTKRWINEAEQMFCDHPLLTLYYEDLLDDIESNLRDACKFLGVQYRSLKTPLKRQNPESMRDLVINYEELKGAFQGTEWQSYFED
jgi:LPS sulfotransferase NodH